MARLGLGRICLKKGSSSLMTHHKCRAVQLTKVNQTIKKLARIGTHPNIPTKAQVIQR